MPDSKTLLFPLFGEFSYLARVPSIAKKGEQQRLADPFLPRLLYYGTYDRDLQRHNRYLFE